MPYANAARRHSPFSAREEVRALLKFAGLYDLRSVFPADRSHTSRGEYPMLLSFAVTCIARVYGSQRKALTELARDGLWDEVVTIYREQLARRKLDEPFIPPVPPTSAQQDRFVKHVTDPRSDLLGQLGKTFTTSATSLARALGNFQPGSDPDFTRPNRTNMIFGDGTFYLPFSSVQQYVDTETGEVTYVGSRSRLRRPRFQEVRSNARADGKTTSGINHVTVSTWTPHGGIVLSNRQALGAEVKAAVEMVDELADLLRDGLHSVVWDRALTGHPAEALTARHGLMVINKAVAAPSTPARRQDKYIPLAITDRDAKDRFTSNPARALPLGTSVYETTTGHDVVRGRIRQLGLRALDDCQHELWVDDGALVDVIRNGPHLYKRASATVTRAFKVFDPRLEKWDFRIELRLPCSNASGGHHAFAHTWKPRQSKTNQPRLQSVLRELHVLPRGDTRFIDAHGNRNATESYNAWAKARLGTTALGGRGMRLDAGAQFLDHICLGVLANAITARRSLRAPVR